MIVDSSSRLHTTCASRVCVLLRQHVRPVVRRVATSSIWLSRECCLPPSDTSETVQYDYLDAHVDQPTSSTIRSGYSIGYGTVRHRTSSPTDHLLTCVGELPIPQPHRSPLSRPPPSKTATKAKPITTKADTRTSRHPHRPHPPPPWKPNEPIASPVSQAWNE